MFSNFPGYWNDLGLHAQLFSNCSSKDEQMIWDKIARHEIKNYALAMPCMWNRNQRFYRNTVQSTSLLRSGRKSFSVEIRRFWVRCLDLRRSPGFRLVDTGQKSLATGLNSSLNWWKNQSENSLTSTKKKIIRSNVQVSKITVESKHHWPTLP